VLPPDSRAILRELLRPPVGCSLDQAIGTTFTVDLTSALVIPLSFAARDLGDRPDPIGVMEAIRACADRVDVFYQAGYAGVPAQSSDLMAFLEPMLHPVKAPRPGRLFHPKVWLLKYTNTDNDVAYRLVCATRNLTSDRSWDAVLALDGWPGRRRDRLNDPISELAGALPTMAAIALPANRVARIRAFADELRRAEWELPEDATDLAFHALGLQRRNTSPDFSGYRRLVVSPFVDDVGLTIVAPPTPRGTVLVARPEHINNLKPLPDDVDTRVFGVLSDVDDEAVPELGGLHAKITIVERQNRSHLFVGSANATDAAYDGNVEFLVEVVRGATKYGVEAHLSLSGGFGGLLEEYSQQPAGPDPEEEQRFHLQDMLRRIAELPWTVTVSGSEPQHDLTISSGATLPDTDAALTLELLARRGETAYLTSGELLHATFSTVPLADISPFLVLTAREGDITESSVIPAVLINDPPGRLDAVLARQVNTPEKFLRFLLLLLGLDNPAALVGDDADGSAGVWAFGGTRQGVFELLARALADQPQALDDLDRLVSRLAATEAGRAVMPPGFVELWTVVNEARQARRPTS
jgi:hypothetical protein